MVAIWSWTALILAALVLPSSDTAPQSSVRVKFVSAPSSYSHGVDSPGPGSATSEYPQGYGRRSSPRSSSPTSTPSEGYPARKPSRVTARRATLVVPVIASDPEAMWPMGVFLPPDTQVLQLILHHDEVIETDPDPFLLTGRDAEAVINALVAHGELFYSDYPHTRALLRHQDERQANGLAGNKLGSIRPESDFYRWPNSKPRVRIPGY
ncbi:uncharacterized protein [Anabrus simplex]|uniref:uncharacterized protein n=1 Tax=Anabrus simplex TaxID=316456 RepID=UPI0035A26795